MDAARLTRKELLRERRVVHGLVIRKVLTSFDTLERRFSWLIAICCDVRAFLCEVVWK